MSTPNLGFSFLFNNANGGSRNGGAAGVFEIFIYKELPSDEDLKLVKNVVINFPSEFKFTTSDFVECRDIENSDAINDCSITATNELNIKILTIREDKYRFQINQIKNPIIERSPFNFGVKLLNSVAGVIASKTLNADSLSFIPPTTVIAELRADSPLVYQATSVTLTFRFNFPIPANSILELKLPLVYQRSSMIVHYIQAASITCSSTTSGVSNSNTCIYTQATQMIRLTGAFPTEIATATTVSIRITPMFSAPTLSANVIRGINRLASSFT